MVKREGSTLMVVRGYGLRSVYPGACDTEGQAYCAMDRPYYIQRYSGTR
jgi:hypothetical protein